jgi:hypothetical protein
MENSVLREIDGKVNTLIERSANQGKQIETIFALMNGGGCSTGRANTTAIKWLWIILCGGFAAVFAVIGYFHVR